MSEMLVGPVLNDRAMFEAVLEAAEMDNPGVRISTEDREGYFRVYAPHRLRLSRKSMEQVLGRPFRLAELEPYLSSFSGRLRSQGEEELVFYLEREARHDHSVY
jgi:toluene monooxygenase system protein D